MMNKSQYAILHYRKAEKCWSSLNQKFEDDCYVVDYVNEKYRSLILDTFGRLLYEDEFEKAVDFLKHLNLKVVKLMTA